ncbi:hypothetical protein GCM10020331_058450 [Ectobacillus funiculus]
MERVYNFFCRSINATTSCIGKKSAKKELVSLGSTGMSVMEMSHRSGVYQNIVTEAETLLRELMNIPENYKVLFFCKVALLYNFSMIPLNLFRNKKADYVNTGSWSKKSSF